MDCTDVYNTTGYTLLSKPRTNKRGGGVGMFVSSGLNFKLRDDLHMNSASCGFESLFIEVKTQKIILLLCDSVGSIRMIERNPFRHRRFYCD